jgi:hypothetical protein
MAALTYFKVETAACNSSHWYNYYNHLLRRTLYQELLCLSEIFYLFSFHWSQLQQVQQLLSSQQIGIHISIFVFITEL